MSYKPPANPWEPPVLEVADLLALRALKEGKASDRQQVIALRCVLLKFCATYDMSFRPGPDGARASDFAEGKRFVGSRILEAIERPLPQPEKSDGRSSDTGTAAAGAAAARINPKPDGRRTKPAKPGA